MTAQFLKRIAGAGVILGVLSVALAPAEAAEAPEGVTLYKVSGSFEDVRFELENAILNRGLVIDYVSHIGTMLARTGADVGSDEEIFTDAQAMLFCSADLSRKVMEAAAENIAYCPYSVFAYEQPDSKGTVTVGFRRLGEMGSEESKKALADVNALLDEIVSEAAGK
ncbi:DUF302 domain-containing protein [Rhodobacterales bacterium]|nr:DUF302 domain-containing protein [Rhodobacterales bacterium]